MWEMVIHSNVFAIIMVGLIWGCTNPFVRKGSAECRQRKKNANSDQQQSPEQGNGVEFSMIGKKTPSLKHRASSIIPDTEALSSLDDSSSGISYDSSGYGEEDSFIIFDDGDHDDGGISIEDGLLCNHEENIPLLTTAPLPFRLYDTAMNTKETIHIKRSTKNHRKKTDVLVVRGGEQELAEQEQGCNRNQLLEEENPEEKESFLKGIIDTLLQFRYPSVLVPYLLNQSGSLFYYKLTATADMTTAIPACNALAMVFSTLTSYFIGERLSDPLRAFCGLFFITLGVMICICATEDIFPNLPHGGSEGGGDKNIISHTDQMQQDL